MRVSTSQKKEWVITRESFDRLLAQLHPDSQHAAEQYERIRGKLVKFFQWRGCAMAEECADKTIDRVAQRIGEGVKLWTEEPYSYFHGVALNVLREYWRRPEQHGEGLESVAESPAISDDPEELMRREAERMEKERLFECLSRCMQKLSPERLRLITEYHQSDKTRRKELAQSLGIPLNALRIRAYRIRSEIEACVENCLKRRSAK